MSESVSNYNPYAAPGVPPLYPGQYVGGGYPAPYQQQGEHGFWREGEMVAVLPWGSRLPDRCVCCNAPAEGRRLTKTLTWHEPVYYLTIFLGVLIYAIVAMSVRKSATFTFGLCRQHDNRRKLGLGLAWGGFVFFLVMMIVGAANGSMPVLLGSMLLMLVTPIVGAVMARVISAARIDGRYGWLKVGRPFLESVPFVAPPDPRLYGGGYWGPR